MPAMKLAIEAFAALVRKNGVALGRLSGVQRHQALALVWSTLPVDGAFSEPQVNQRLLAALAGVGAFLDTDHVELRRWLVDAGWLYRDDWGRRYRPLPADLLPPELQAVAAALSGLDSAAWVAAERAAVAALREDRRRRWQPAAAGA